MTLGVTRRQIPTPLRAALVVALLYLFLVAVSQLESGIKDLGSDIHDRLFEGVTNPLAGLFVGVLGTVLVQSSSVTTSTIVGLVASGVVGVEAAVPMVMGANIGTTVTNTLISLGHVRRSEEFRRAFAGATMHDFFNVLSVLALLPLEITTKFLSRGAEAVTRVFAGRAELGGDFNSPIKGAVKAASGLVHDGLEAIVSSPVTLGVVGILIGLAGIYVALTFVTRNMRDLIAERIERSLNASLSRSGLVGMAVGLIVTMAVQSSSITTSILIPLIAAGILALDNAYPITLGANIGTTLTALLAALGTGSVDALTIAFAHTVFNVIGILIFFPVKPLRRIPVRLAVSLADITARNRTLVGVYVLGVFILLPIVGILILS
ncbi:MAG: Na/Pi symporter [Acidimicrobiia bacterium]